MKCPAFVFLIRSWQSCFVYIKSFFLKDKTNAITFVNHTCFKNDIYYYILKKKTYYYDIYISESTFFFNIQFTKDPRTAAHLKRYVLSTSANLSEERINRRLAAELRRETQKNIYNETVNTYLGYANRCYPRYDVPCESTLMTSDTNDLLFTWVINKFIDARGRGRGETTQHVSFLPLQTLQRASV